jgi:hypothetical protein
MLTDQQEQELKEKLAATAKENAVLSVFAKSGIRSTKVTKAYVEAAVSVEIREGNSPVITATEPTTGRTYANLDAFIEAVKGDPDFQPATSQSSSGGNGRSQPRHVAQQDLIAEGVSPEQIESGEVIVDMPQPTHRELKENEISAHDQRQLSVNLEKIARGETRVVFPGRV